MPQRCQFTEEAQAPSIEGGFQLFQEKPPIEPRENVDGQEEVRAAGDPLPVIPFGRDRRQAAAWNDAVEMGMMAERLPPCVQDGDEADLGAQVSPVGGDGA